MTTHHVTLLPNTFAVCRLDAEAAIPGWATTGTFFSITRTTEEISIVCEQSVLPKGVRCERDRHAVDTRCRFVCPACRHFTRDSFLVSLSIP